MAKQKKPNLTPVERMIAGKRKLIARLKDDIADDLARHDEFKAGAQKRIRIAQALVDALERGTLTL